MNWIGGVENAARFSESNPSIIVILNPVHEELVRMSAIEIKPLTVTIGAEIHGVDLREPLDSAETSQIRKALLDHLVVFFRDQDITPAQHVAFGQQFGELCFPPFMTDHGNDPAILVLDQKAPRGEGTDTWHSDNTFMTEPPLGSILKAIELPALGGDTCFASAYAAYESLSPAIQSFVDGLTAVHDLTATLERANAAGHTQADIKAILKESPPVEHPVVRTHPETGRKALFVNANSTTRIVGLSERENELLLPFLCGHIGSPEFQCRFKWAPHSIAFWDNRAAQHLAVPDYEERRVMHRVTLAGDRPF
ncbi:MAG: TauD/TfdA family dioxygenase [Myxococcota bacterium]|jgi:taurine dioxygenase